jgi:hypothetical protein
MILTRSSASNTHMGIFLKRFSANFKKKDKEGNSKEGSSNGMWRAGKVITPTTTVTESYNMVYM